MEANLKKAFVSFRIGVAQWMPEHRFRELLDLFDKHRGVTDEITFFTSETHPPLPLSVIEERMALLAQRMPQVRQRGYRTGINILATIGHHNENLPNSLSGDYTPMTDIDGNVCLGSFCPNDDKMRDYIKQLYRIVAAANPDYIWIDDDIRLFGHLPIACGCFCDICLELFAQETGTKYNRMMLKSAFDSGLLEDRIAIRRAWLQHNRNMIARLLELIEKTVHAIQPSLPLGFMTGDRFYEGYDFDNWTKILSGAGKAEVMWRPGGGFYADDRLSDLTEKAHSIGRQVSMLPPEVVSIQSEIENFPYQRLQKSAHVTALEAAAYIASGCTGSAFNVLSMYDEPLDEYEPLIRKLHDTRPFLDLLARALGRSPNEGISVGWNKDSFVGNRIEEGNWISSESPTITGGYAKEILQLGLPASYSLGNAQVVAISGSNVLAMNEKEILTMLSKGVYMDAPALEQLNRMGYQELTGFQVERWIEDDCIEEFTSDAINTSFARSKRDGRQSFWWRLSAGMFTPLSGTARILARAVDYAGEELSPCCMGVFENRLGGRVCVAGYYPWTFLQNGSKSAQVKKLMLWLSKDKLPAYISSFHKMNLWVRKPEEGKLAVVIINAYMDTAENVVINLLTDQDKLTVFDMRCSETEIHYSGKEGHYRQFILPPIQAWQMRLIIV